MNPVRVIESHSGGSFNKDRRESKSEWSMTRHGLPGSRHSRPMEKPPVCATWYVRVMLHRIPRLWRDLGLATARGCEQIGDRTGAQMGERFSRQ